MWAVRRHEANCKTLQSEIHTITHNPYSPPTAPVGGVETKQVAGPVDKNVSRACALTWLSTGLVLIVTPIEYRNLQSAAPPPESLLQLVAACAVLLLLTWWIVAKLQAGRNWMRVLLTVLIVLATLSTFIERDFHSATLVTGRTSLTLTLIHNGLHVILDLSVVALLFSPSARAWFAAKKAIA